MPLVSPHPIESKTSKLRPQRVLRGVWPLDRNRGVIFFAGFLRKIGEPGRKASLFIQLKQLFAPFDVLCGVLLFFVPLRLVQQPQKTLIKK